MFLAVPLIASATVAFYHWPEWRRAGQPQGSVMRQSQNPEYVDAFVLLLGRPDPRDFAAARHVYRYAGIPIGARHGCGDLVGWLQRHLRRYRGPPAAAIGVAATAYPANWLRVLRPTGEASAVRAPIS